MSALQDFMAVRERDLAQQILALRAQLVPLEEEMEDIRRARRATEMPAAKPQGGTIQDAALYVLARSPSGTATVLEIQKGIKDAMGREVSRVSLSPQMSRLAHGGYVELHRRQWVITALGREREIAIPATSPNTGRAPPSEAAPAPTSALNDRATAAHPTTSPNGAE